MFLYLTYQVQINGGEGTQRINLLSEIRSEIIHPNARLNKWTQRIRPDSFEVTPLGERDRFSDARNVYQLILSYKLSKLEDGKTKPRLPLLNNRLYESPFESQMCMIFDENKKYIGCSEAVPRAIDLKRGSYTVRVQEWHN